MKFKFGKFGKKAGKAESKIAKDLEHTKIPKEKIKGKGKSKVKLGKAAAIGGTALFGGGLLNSLSSIFGSSNRDGQVSGQPNSTSDTAAGNEDNKSEQKKNKQLNEQLNNAAAQPAKEDIRKATAEQAEAKKELDLHEQLIKASEDLDRRTQGILDDYGLKSPLLKRVNRGTGTSQAMNKHIPHEFLSKAQISRSYEKKNGDPRLSTIIKLLGASNELLGQVQFNIGLLIKQGSIVAKGKLESSKALKTLAQADLNAANSLNADAKVKEKKIPLSAAIPLYLKDHANLTRSTTKAQNALDMAAVLGLLPLFSDKVSEAFSGALSDIVGNFLDKPEDAGEEKALEIAKQGAFDNFTTQLKILAGVTGLSLLGETSTGKAVRKAGNKVAEKTSEKLAQHAEKKAAEKVTKNTLRRNTKASTIKVGRRISQRIARTQAAKVAAKASQKVGKTVVGKASKKAAQKILKLCTTKLASKTVAKKIPIVGTVCGLYYAVDRWKRGDWVAGLGELTSGIVSGLGSLTGIVSAGAGTVASYAASFAIDAALLASDYKRACDALDRGDIDLLRKVDWDFGDIAEIAMEMDSSDPLRVNFNKRYPDVKSVLKEYGSDGLAALMGMIDSFKEGNSPIYTDFYKNYNTVEKLLTAGVDITDIAKVAAQNPDSAISKDLRNHPEYVNALVNRRGYWNTTDIDSARIAQANPKSPFGRAFIKQYGDPKKAIDRWGEKKGTWSAIKGLFTSPISTVGNLASNAFYSAAGSVGLSADKILGTANSLLDRRNEFVKNAKEKNKFLGFLASAATGGFGIFAKGGMIKGPSHSDGGVKFPEVGAELEGGEYVINKKATAKHKDLVEAINNDTLDDHIQKTTAKLDSKGNSVIQNGQQVITIDQSKLAPAIVELGKAIRDLKEEFRFTRKQNLSSLKAAGADYKFSDKEKSNKTKKKGSDEENSSSEQQYDSYNSPGEGAIDGKPADSVVEWVAQNVEGKVNSYSQTDFQLTGPGTMKGDCSGMVQAAYRSQGINIPRSSNEQWQSSQGIVVDRSTTPNPARLKPGDLLFYTTGGGRVTHVEMYMGNNQMIGNGSNGVRRRRRVTGNLGGESYLGAKRFTSNTNDTQSVIPETIAAKGGTSPSLRKYEKKSWGTPWTKTTKKDTASVQFEETDETFPNFENDTVKTDQPLVAQLPTVNVGNNSVNNVDNSVHNVNFHTNVMVDNSAGADLA